MAFIYNGTTFTSKNNIIYNGNDVSALVYNDTVVWSKAEPVTVTAPTIALVKEYFNGFDEAEKANWLYDSYDPKKLRFGASIWYPRNYQEQTFDYDISIKKAGYTKATIWLESEMRTGGDNTFFEASMTVKNGANGFDAAKPNGAGNPITNWSCNWTNYNSSVFQPYHQISYILPSRDASIYYHSKAWGQNSDAWYCAAYVFIVKFSLE